MKKLLVTGVAAAVLLGTGAGFDHKAEAAKANINYLSSSVVKKAKAGTLTMDGFKIGAKAGTYLKSKKYYKEGTRKFWMEDWNLGIDEDLTLVDWQSSKKVSSSNRTITRIIDKNIDNRRKIERDDILAKYGDPLISRVYNNSYDGYDSRRVDVYQNITFFYKWRVGYNEVPTLDGVVIMHNKTKAAQEKWAHYAENEANMDVEEMMDYIPSTDWASY